METETQKNSSTVKASSKTNKYLPKSSALQSSFSQKRDRQAFLQERRQMNFQKCSSVYESRRQTSSLAACPVFNVKGAPNKMSSRRCYSGKKLKRKMASDVPEIKPFKLVIFG